ncbi:MAG TPA: envelope stress response membrane protein PspC [bacterium]|nr:envelope stress response membrane protein PspC [bacterium]
MEKGLYRARDGAIFGVCKGLADRFDLAVFWVRVAAVALTLFSGLAAGIVAYIVVALVMKPAPAMPFASDDDREFYDSFTHSRSLALNRLKRTMDLLDRRIQRIEDRVTTKDFDWESRMHR